MRIDGATILVTGGASGLGAACVQALAAGGANVIAADLAFPAGAAPADRVRNAGCDVTDETAVRQALAAAPAGWGPLRGAVHCAGVLHSERLLGRTGPASLAAFRRVLEINLTGSFNVCRLAAEAMMAGPPDEQGERGAIVMTSSIAAEDGQIGQAAYAASKGGVAALTLPLARELGRSGVRVVSIAPGAFETAMLAAAPDKLRDALAEQTPFPPRLGRAEEFAALVRHVLENSMLNGSLIRLDGGLRMAAK